MFEVRTLRPEQLATYRVAVLRLDAHVDLDGAGFMSIRIRMGDYRMVDGVKVPFRTEVINQATGRAIQQVLEIQPGVTPDPTAFESPEGV